MERLALRIIGQWSALQDKIDGLIYLSVATEFPKLAEALQRKVLNRLDWEGRLRALVAIANDLNVEWPESEFRERYRAVRERRNDLAHLSAIMKSPYGDNRRTLSFVRETKTDLHVTTSKIEHIDEDELLRLLVHAKWLNDVVHAVGELGLAMRYEDGDRILDAEETPVWMDPSRVGEITLGEVRRSP